MASLGYALKGYVQGNANEEDPYARERRSRCCPRRSAKSRSGTESIRYSWLVMKAMYPRLISVAVAYTLTLLLIEIAKQVNIYNIGLIPSKFYHALLDGSVEEYKTILWEMCVLVFAVSLCIATENLFQSLLALDWRRNVTNKIHLKYLKDNNTCLLIHARNHLDNPDQRITQDISLLTKLQSEILINIIILPFTIIYYTYRVWKSADWIGVVGVYVFFLGSALFNKVLSSPVVPRVVRREQWEGDFRFYHVMLREHADSIALQRSFHVEAEKLGRTFQGTLESQREILHWRFPLQMAISITDYMGSLVAYGIIAIPIFSGWYKSQSYAELTEHISQSVFFTIYLINQFTRIIDQINNLYLVSGFSIRVGELLEQLKKIETEENGAEQHGLGEEGLAIPLIINDSMSGNTMDEDSIISLKDVTIYTRDMSPLINKLSFSITPGCNTLIMGPSGCGKSALIKSIAGTWPYRAGEISGTRPLQPPDVIFVPQTPFLSSGTIVDQVIYPLENTGDVVDGDKVAEALKSSNLGHLLDRLGREEFLRLPEWNALSPGEKQRIYFARLFYHRPSLAVLDEATSSTDEETEADLYQACIDLRITLLSVGHRSSLRKFHKRVLSIKRGGNWKWEQ